MQYECMCADAMRDYGLLSSSESEREYDVKNEVCSVWFCLFLSVSFCQRRERTIQNVFQMMHINKT